jgi:CRISPR-associated protein Cas1
MGWRILQLTKPCKISVKNKQLFYDPSEGESVSLPIEDLSVVILETGFVQLTGSLLSELASAGVVLFACDHAHQPSGVFFPFHEHSRYSEMAHIQIAASGPLKKRLWAEIVRQKVLNQSAVLRIFSRADAEVLVEISKRIQSGDQDNREGYAASIYWKSLFDNFVRRDDSNILNKALNYGYAIMRGCIARNIAAAGLLPCFGIHHDNHLNQFNLVDDLIEPFRPFVDYVVHTINFGDAQDLTPELKSKLVSVLLYNCTFNSEEIQLLKAVEMSAESMARAFRYQDVRALKLPEIKSRPQIAGDNG